MVDTDISTAYDNLINGNTTTAGLVISILLVVAWFKIFQKADEPGWAALLPLYNIYVLCKIVWGNKKVLHFILLLIPLVNIFVYISTSVRLCKAFGKDTLFAILSIFFPNITTLIIGFDNSQYQTSYKY